MHNGNIYRPFAQTATGLYHDEETNISQKTLIGQSDNSLATLLGKKVHARLCEVVNTRAEVQAEKRIQHKA